MEQLRLPRPFSRIMNALGLRVLIAAAALCWFIWLWGLCVPAVLAGMALGLMGQLLMSQVCRQHSAAREEALRRQLGGMLVLDELLLCSPADAAKAAVALLQPRLALTPERTVPEGMLCRMAHERVLVRFIQRHQSGELGCDDVLAFVRACREHRADRGVLCAACGVADAALSCADGAPLPLMLVGRSELLALAGAAAPATDEQLTGLLVRQHPSSTVGALVRRVLHPQKARRFMGYGLGLTLLYVLTGLRWYLAPGLLCMVLGAACRFGKAQTNDGWH